MKTREDFIIWLFNNGKLNRFDTSFIQSLVERVGNLKAVTTKQALLLEKIVLRYRQQLKDHNLDIVEILGLPWKHALKESRPAVTDATLSVVDNKIILRFAYHKELVRLVKEARSASNIFITWNSELLQWETEFTIRNLNILYNITKQFKANFEYCVTIQSIVEYVSQYGDSDAWKTKLVRLPSGYYVVNNISQTLADALPNFTDNLTEKTVDQLTELGIYVDVSLLPINIQLNRPTVAQLLTNKIVTFKASEVTAAVVDDLKYYIKMLDGWCFDETGILSSDDILSNLNNNVDNLRMSIKRGDRAHNTGPNQQHTFHSDFTYRGNLRKIVIVSE